MTIPDQQQTTELAGFRLAGRFGVDSGLCLIGDPYYTKRASKRLADSDGRPGQIMHPTDDGKSEFPAGVAVNTLHGDGIYPVYVKNDGSEIRILLS